MAGYSQGYPYLQQFPISPHVAQQFPVVSQAHLQQFLLLFMWPRLNLVINCM